MKTTTVLFTGYAPVHFVCFRPLYERLFELPDFEVFLSGGLRTPAGDGYLYNERALYAPFGVPQDRILTVAEIEERDFDLFFSASTGLIPPRSASARVQIFHGISFRNRSVRAKNLASDFYFLVGPYMHRKFIQAGFFSENDSRALRIGFPKTDRLLDGSLDHRALLRRCGFAGDRPVLLYAPTGGYHNSLETMGENAIYRLAKTGRYDILIKLHDHPKNTGVDWFSRLSVFEDDHTRIARDLDVIPLLYLSDLLITDASSVSSEYSLLDRPMVFLDVPELIQKMARRQGSMLDLQSWGRRAGEVVEKPEDIVAAVEGGLADRGRLSEIRRAMAEDLFYNPGSAAEEAIAWIKSRSWAKASLPL